MADLSELVLLCNDPDVAAQFEQSARCGDVDAQYGLGLIYAEGRGVQQDEASAYFWLTLAVRQGDEEARVLRRVVTASMTAEQFDQADQLLHAYDQSPSPAVRAVRRRRRQRKSDGRSRDHVQ